jgi:oligopeptide transport system substrate-binding protein
MRLRSSVAATATVLTLLLFQAAPAEAAKVLHRPNGSEIESLDPQKGVSVYDIVVQRDLLEGLAVLDMDKHPVPGAAQSWEVSDDGLTWTFHLRPDGKWSNGDPVVAGDFVYAMRREVDPATGGGNPSALDAILNAEAIIAGREKDPAKLGVEAVDPLTLRIHLTSRSIVFPLRMTDNSALPLHRATVEKWGQDWPKPGHYVGNGAFVLKDMVPQSVITLTKNPLYHDAAKVKLDEVDYYVADNQLTALRRWEAGEIDTDDTIPGKELKRLQAAYGSEMLEAPINSHGFLPINMTRAPLGTDPRLREALNLAVDRETIVGKIIPTGDKPAYALLPPIIPGYTPQPMFFKDMPKADRIVKAKQLLAEAGYGPDHPLTVTIIYPTKDDTRTQLLAIASMWQQIGIVTKLDNMEWPIYLSKVQRRDYEIGIMGEYGSYDDPEDALLNYTSSNPSYNWPGYKSEAFDKLFDQGKVAATEAERYRLFEQAEHQMMTDMPIIPLKDVVLHTLVHHRVQGWRANVEFPLSKDLSVTD